ncbi:MAG: segregation/condensation protein A [Tissierellia bacterium]|nr:segregation/condensation protein A [Tissierellia bacterium]
MDYNIILESFEGPMDLLMHLIDQAEIDIYDININEITEQYIEHITKMDEMDLEVTGEFLLMAATLLEIKSKMLLPQEVADDTGSSSDIDDIDPRLELVRKLIEYRRYKHASKTLKRLEEDQYKVHFKPQEDLSYYLDQKEDLEEMDLDKLVSAFNNILIKARLVEESIYMDEIIRERYTLEECMQRIKDLLQERGTIKFSNLFTEDPDRTEIIVIFLSLLELIRINTVTVKQESDFSDILIYRTSREG